jgi:citrate lyase subunit beta/citryl-CoA lyase
MKISQSIRAGRQGKADIEIELGTSEKETISVELKSSVERLFGNHLRTYIEAFLKRFDITSCVVSSIDDGALDFVVKSRLEAALYKHDSSLLERFDFETKPQGEQGHRFRRTRLYIPGNNPYLMEGCGLFGADVIILDLEDAVSQNEKVDARFVVRNALGTLDFGDAEVIVRINPFSNRGEEDVKTVLGALPDAIMLPKTGCAADVLKLDRILEEEEKRIDVPIGSIKIFPLIETAEGVLNSQKIATASKRNVMLTFGAEDFTADIGVKRSQEGNELFFARSQIVLAARAAGIQASDTVYSDFENIEGLVEDTKVSKSLGFDGRGVIHPLQIEHIHRVYQPTSGEIEYAKKVVGALEEAEKRGSGVISLGRKMIDAPVAKRARRILKLAERYRLLKKAGD